MVVVESFLKTNNINYIRHDHSPVYTGDELEMLGIPGLACKNLFLRDQKSRRFLLIVLPATKKTDLKKLGEITGAGKLSFANPQTLQSKLGVEPGAVSPFGLLNDVKAEIKVYIDIEIRSTPAVQFHPNLNTATLELTSVMFNKFLDLLPHSINWTHM